jgi:hypothetical protein
MNELNNSVFNSRRKFDGGVPSRLASGVDGSTGERYFSPRSVALF